MRAARDQPGEMGDVDDEIGAHRVADRSKPLEIPMAGVGGAAGDDQLRPVLARERLDLIHVDAVRFPIDAVGDDLEPLAGNIDRRAMRQVSPGGEIQAHEHVAGLHQRQKHALIGLRAGIGLHVREPAGEQPAGAIDRQFLRDIDELTAAVIAAARIAFGIFVGQHRALRLQNGARDDVLRGDQLDFIALATELQFDRARDFRIGVGEAGGKERIGADRRRGGGNGHGEPLRAEENLGGA